MTGFRILVWLEFSASSQKVLKVKKKEKKNKEKEEILFWRKLCLKLKSQTSDLYRTSSQRDQELGLQDLNKHEPLLGRLPKQKTPPNSVSRDGIEDRFTDIILQR